LLYWAYIESDFLHFYNIDNPLLLVWTKFRRLLFALPPESNFFRLLHQKTESLEKEEEEKKQTPNQWAKDKFRETFNKPKRKANKTLSLDDISG